MKIKYQATFIKCLFVGLLTVMMLVNSAPFLMAQTPEQAQQELQKLGLDDQIVKEKLLQRGIDVDNIDINNPEEIFNLEKNLGEVIAEIEKERVQETIGTPDEKTDLKSGRVTEEEKKILVKEAEDISESLEEGATLEEAVSEELNEALESELPKGKLYGQEIFRSQNLKLYRQSEDVKPPGSYILGVGDVIAISIWGYSEQDLVFEINKDGFIKPDRIPRINLKGLTLDDARGLLEKRFSNYYRFESHQFEVTLNYGRTINVNIVGEVYNYGTFNIPAINSAFNALVAAGGPNDIGSVRNIKLVRFGQPHRNIDIYKYLQDPEYEVDLYLQERDVISVPIAEKIVKLEGAVIRPHNYELKDNEHLIELLEFCGGLKSNASLRNIQIKRFEQDQEKIIDVNLNQVIQSNSNFDLRNGDVVLVNEITRSFENFVTLNGAVQEPGKYAIEGNTRVSDLLKKTKLNPDALTDVAYLQRLNDDQKTTSYIRIDLAMVLQNPSHSDNIQLQAKDQLVVYSKSKFVDQEVFSVKGAVRDPGDMNYDFSKTLKLNDAIFLAGGSEKHATDFAYIKRKDPNNVDRLIYLRADLDSALEFPASNDNVEILPGDEIVVYSQKDFVDEKTIYIDGAVRNPGSYKYDPSLSIKDLITMSGGLKFSASRKRVDIYRLEFEDEQKTKTLAANLILDQNDSPINGEFGLKAFDRIIVREAPEFETMKTVTLTGEVKYPGDYALVRDNESIASVIKRAGGPTDEAFLSGGVVMRSDDNTGYISVDLNEAYRNNGSRHNIVLKANDRITIPKKKDLVSIVGETKASEMYLDFVASQGQVNVPFVDGKDAKYYIDEYAGGINDNGDKDEITVSYPNGVVKRTKRFLFWRKYPVVYKGSIVRVGRKEIEKKEETVEKEPFDWGAFFRDTIAAVTAVLTVVVLAQRIE